MLDLSINTETHDKIRKQQRNRDWLSQNLKEVQANYEEQWVAVADEKIVANDLTADEVKGKVEGKYPGHEVLILRIPKEEISRPM